jgi:NDP-sugar pyrophosphorylase family protein
MNDFSSMRAYLLAGGRGERLRPLTTHVPKCLAPIGGRPLLAYWLSLCRREGITEVLLNVSHHFEMVEAFLASAPEPAPRVTVVREHEPSGTATTVRRERWFADGAADVWVFYADNLSDIRLEPMRQLHAAHSDSVTVGLFHAASPKSAGIVELDPTGRIVSFVEKPADPRSTLANAGVYLLRRDAIDAIPDGDAVDFGQHVLPALVGRMHGYVIPDFHEDIGTPERLVQTTARWAARTAS